MSHKLRNLTVGLVVLASLCILAWMIFKFGAEPAKFFRPPQIEVTFDADRADGLGDGSTIHYRGVEVGRILGVSRDPATDTISIRAQIAKRENLPNNLTADIVITSPLGGVSAIELKLAGPPSGVPLKQGDKLHARYLGSTFLPPEFADLARNANDTVKQFNDAKLIESVKQTVDLTRQRIDQLSKVIDGASSFINDPKLREDVTASLASMRATADNAKTITESLKSRVDRIGDRAEKIADKTEQTIDAAHTTLDSANKRIDEIGASVGQQLVKVSKMLDNVTEISAKLNNGTGTAGQLVNDPKLYQALVDATRELNGGLSDFRRLLQQWEQEGVTLKLGK